MQSERNELPAIAVFSGPTATIQNSPPLVTSDKARRRRGLVPRPGPGGRPRRFDALRPQRLAAPVTVYVEQFSAHPLEADAAGLYGPPDGWLDAAGTLHESPRDGARPVYRIDLDAADGLYLLPYMAFQADGQAWEDATAEPGAPAERSRQTFYPDAERLYEEIDRFGIGFDGQANALSSLARFEFFRAAPSGGYRNGPTIEERPGQDYFAYYPRHLHTEPSTAVLARATNLVQRTLARGGYIGAQWLEGSPTIEESLYWLGLLVDTDKPIVGHAAQRPHQTMGADGDQNIVDGARYLLSRAWAGADEKDRIGAVLVVDQRAFAAREVAKTDARAGNYAVTGGHGGIVAALGGDGPVQVTFVPTRAHTHRSALRLPCLPSHVMGVRRDGSLLAEVTVPVRDEKGDLIEAAMPRVTIEKYSRYRAVDDGEPGISATIEDDLARFPLAGFVGEGASPYGSMQPEAERLLRRAACSGMPVVTVGRGNTEGFAYHREALFVAGSNLTATKARLLLMASLLALGALPPAKDPEHPTDAELAAIREKVARYQQIFDTH